jgi:RNA polymerase sigma factor (sigma-70 family)
MTPRSLIEPARLAGAALLHTQSDERLVDMTRAGNGRAFEAIVARYRKPLLRYCGGLLPPERAEDAVQQAFLNAYKAIADGEAQIKLRPWLYKVAHNASLNLLRQNGWNYDQIPEDFDGVIQPPQAVEQSEHIREVVQAVKALPERQRDAVILRELEGRSYEEISAALGVSGGAVRQLLHRARTTLRAGATSITPPGLLEWLADRTPVDAPVASRIAEVAAGAGGAATLAKVGTALVVAGAVAGGVVAGPLHKSHHGRAAEDAAQAAELTVKSAGLAPASGSPGATTAIGAGPGGNPGSGSVAQAIQIALGQPPGHHQGAVFGPGGAGSTLGGGGQQGSGSGGDRSGSGHSGDGGGGSDHGSGSGSGSGGDHSGSGSSGDRSGGGDHSGSGSGSSGSGSGSSGSGSTGSGSSGSGTSGSGDGSDGGDSGSSGPPPPTGTGTGTGVGVVPDGSGKDGSGTSGSGTDGSDKSSPVEPPDPNGN